MNHLTRLRVLVAAGNGMRVRVLSALGAAGVTIAAECGSAPEAIEAAARERPDVCVVDRDLPGGALAAAAAIASPAPAPRVIVVGGRESDAARRAALFAGATEYLPGEPDGPELATVVHATTRRNA